MVLRTLSVDGGVGGWSVGVTEKKEAEGNMAPADISL